MRRYFSAGWLAVGVFASALSMLTIPASAQAPAEKPFVAALPAEPDVMDLLSTRTNPVALATLANIVEPLVGMGADGQLKPEIASWTVSEDSRTITFKIRDGVKFHTGDPLTAKDIEFSHQRAMAKTLRYEARMVFLEKLEIIDDRTVAFRFKQPDATFLQSRALFIVSKAYHDRVGEEAFMARPVGTGPYKFVERRPGEWVDLEAFDGYWEGAPKIKKVRIRYIKDDVTRVAALKAGEVDLIMATPYPSVADVEKSGFKNISLATHPTTSLLFSLYNPSNPWHDKRVRLAIAQAIDANGIVKTLFHGVPQRYVRLDPLSLGYDASLKPYAFDPAAARKLLAEAGFANGFPMTIHYMHGSWSGYKETAEAVVLYLRAVGINATAQALDAAQINEMLSKQKKEGKNANFVALYPTSVANWGDVTQNIQAQMHSRAVFSTYNNPEIDRLLDAAGVTMDAPKRGEYLRQLIRLMHDDVLTIQLWNGVMVYSMKAAHSYTPIPQQSPRLDLKMLK